MNNVGKCPKCDGAIYDAEIEHVQITENFRERWNGVSYHCPHCHIVISVGLDPASLKADLVSEVTKAVTEALGRR
jgi:hypothetical protein